jgi:hypothetical protein
MRHVSRDQVVAGCLDEVAVEQVPGHPGAAAGGPLMPNTVCQVDGPVGSALRRGAELGGATVMPGTPV